MTREDVLAVLMKNIADVLPEMKGVKIDPKKTNRELGVSSLDLVMIVANTTRDLKVKVPPADLTNVTSLDGLVDVLVKVANQPKWFIS
jgi:acyl carrier protein